MRPFDLKIRPIILKFQGLCREVLAILYFLVKMQDSSFRKSKFEFSKFVYKNFEGSPGDPWGSPGIPGGPRGPRLEFQSARFEFQRARLEFQRAAT